MLINRGWEAPPDPTARDPDAHVVSKLAALQLHRACPAGFVFIWVDKQHIAPVMDLMYKWRFVYVENLNWLLLGADNQLLGLPADYFARSHLTLFIFRKDGMFGGGVDQYLSCVVDHLSCVDYCVSVGVHPPLTTQVLARTLSCVTSATQTCFSIVCRATARCLPRRM